LGNDLGYRQERFTNIDSHAETSHSTRRMNPKKSRLFGIKTSLKFPLQARSFRLL
jgi:hypothetical protein